MIKASVEFISGMLICWLLNVVQLGIAFVLLSSSEKMLPSVYVLTAALGVVQFGYIAPIYRLLRRKGRLHSARGLLTAACLSVVVNFFIDYHFWGNAIFRFWR